LMICRTGYLYMAFNPPLIAINHEI